MSIETRVSPERLAKFVDTCRAMGDAGDGARYDWWDDLTKALVELQGVRARGRVPENARERMYYPIIMPLNADGQGPASEALGEIRKITWQVWDQFCDTFGDFDCLPDAIMESERLNRDFYARTAVREQEQEPVAYGVYLTDGRFMDIASDNRDDAVTMAEALYDPPEFVIKPLYLSPSAYEGKATDEMIERIGEAVYGRHGRGWVMWPLVTGAEIKSRIRAALDTQGGGNG